MLWGRSARNSGSAFSSDNTGLLGIPCGERISTVTLAVLFTIPEHGRQTDARTDRHLAQHSLCIASRGKNSFGAQDVVKKTVL